MVWAFNVEPALDEKGQQILPDADRLTQGFVCMPEEYPARITPRSKAKADMIVKEWKEAEKQHLDPETKQWLLSPVE